jgi:hypothetical protein
MKKLLISSLSLIAASAYAQPSGSVIPYNPVAVVNALHGIAASPLHPSGPTEGDVARNTEVLPNASDRSLEGIATRPNTVSPSATQATQGGNGGLLVGNGATPAPPPTMYSGVGPLPANDTKAPVSLDATGGNGGKGGLIGNGGTGGEGVANPAQSKSATTSEAKEGYNGFIVIHHDPIPH